MFYDEVSVKADSVQLVERTTELAGKARDMLHKGDLTGRNHHV